MDVEGRGEIEARPPPEREGGLEPDPDLRWSNIGRLLLRAFELFEDRIRTGLHERGFQDFGPADARVIRNLDLEGTRITELAERARVTKQAVSQTVQDLEDRGLVRRVPDPADGRAKLVRLTGRGRRLIACGQEVNRRLLEEWEGAIGDGGVAELRSLLERLLAELAPDTGDGTAPPVPPADARRPRRGTGKRRRSPLSRRARRRFPRRGRPQCGGPSAAA